MHGRPPCSGVRTIAHFLVLDPSPQVTEQSLHSPLGSTLQSCLHRLLSHSSVWKSLAGQAFPPCSGLRTISNSLLLVHFFPLRVREQSHNLFVLVLQCTGKRSWDIFTHVYSYIIPINTHWCGKGKKNHDKLIENLTLQLDDKAFEVYFKGWYIFVILFTLAHFETWFFVLNITHCVWKITHFRRI